MNGSAATGAVHSSIPAPGGATASGPALVTAPAMPLAMASAVASASASASARAIAMVLVIALTTVQVLAQTGGTGHVLVVSGIGGEDHYSDRFQRLGAAMVTAARERMGLADERITWLAEDPARAPDVIDGTSRREHILAALAALAASTGPGDRVVLLLIGHATARGERVLFNVPGPDLSAEALADALDPLAGREVMVVIATASSGAFLPALSAPGRVLITATADASEDQHPLFATSFLAAISDAAADADKDARVSALEAFRYTVREVARAYDRAGRILTEHALLDDNGDGVGSRRPAPDATDGAVAATAVLVDASAAAGDDPRRLELEREAQALLERIEALKRDKGGLAEADFLERLEAILVDLAINRREWRGTGS